jgi:hypothetical protein
MPTTSDPSPEQIRIACWKIQERWSPAERRRRAGCYAEREVVRIPEGIDLGDSWRFEEAAEA